MNAGLMAQSTFLEELEVGKHRKVWAVKRPCGLQRLFPYDVLSSQDGTALFPHERG